MPVQRLLTNIAQLRHIGGGEWETQSTHALDGQRIRNRPHIDQPTRGERAARSSGRLLLMDRGEEVAEKPPALLLRFCFGRVGIHG